MKGLILSGGAGTRLRPITYTSAKQLVPVANKPILFYGIEDMAAAGITDIGIIVGDTHAEIEAAVGDGSQFGVHVNYIRQAAPLGLAHCVLIARDFLGDDDFVMYLGDNLLQQGLKDFVSRFVSERELTPTVAQILLYPVPDPHRFGVAEVDAAGRVMHLVEKPADPPSNLALVGVYLFDSSIHEAVRAIEPSPRGELEITDAIQWLIDHGRTVRHEVLQGWWLDTGKKDPLLESNMRVLETLEPRIEGKLDGDSKVEGRVVVEEGAELINSRVRGPAIIGRGTRLVDTYIGPYTAVAGGCEIVDSEIEHSVICDDCRIQGVHRISDSLLGRNVEVMRSGTRPRATRLMLGDDSSVDLG
ncbi:MAG: glucose-1-phosphate thymidylyltransferase [Acidimicrobiales bacterium]